MVAYKEFYIYMKINKSHIKTLIFTIFLFLGYFAFSNTDGDVKRYNLTEYIENQGATLSWDSLSGSGILEKNGHTVSFRVDDGLVISDYKNFFVTDAPIIENGNVYITENFAEVCSKVFSLTNSVGYFKVGAVLIDAGHGGKDPGATETHTINGKKTNVQEKDITLNVAKKLFTMLEKQYPDKKILMTRTDDKFLSLEERVEIANNVELKEHEAILYISIHVNAAFDKKASGFEVWYLSPGYRRKVIDENVVEDKSLATILNSMMEEEYTTESILIAKYISEGLENQVGAEMNNRGIKQEEWFVVRNANMPSVLIELGFLTNPTEAAFMTNETYLQKMTNGIYNGLTKFITHFEKSRGFTGL